MDKNGILKVCVDDFAFKKRYSYGSILINIETHTIIDLLDSREKEPVAKWLKKYPNLQRKIAPYETEIIKLQSQEVTYAKITEIIRRKGHCG